MCNDIRSAPEEYTNRQDDITSRSPHNMNVYSRVACANEDKL